MQTLPAVWAGGVRTHLAGGAVRPPPRPADPAGLSCGPRPGPLGHTAQHPAGRPRPRPQVCFEGLAAAVPWRGAWPGGLGSGSPPPGGPVSPAKGGMCVCGEAAGAEDAGGGLPGGVLGAVREPVFPASAPRAGGHRVTALSGAAHRALPQPPGAVLHLPPKGN